MVIKLEGVRKSYTPKDSDPVECRTHGIKTTWGALNAIQRLAVESNLDASDDLPCILEPRP